MTMKKFTFLATSLLLVGCGDNAHIQQVKEMVAWNDNTITVGNALDHRAICQKVTWETVNDERHRDIVRYTCQISPKIANQLITRHISELEQKVLNYLEKQTHFFNNENKQAQLSRFYLKNGENGLKEISDNGIPLAYLQLKNELLQYLYDNYKAKEYKNVFSDVNDFRLPKILFKNYKAKQYIIQLRYNGERVSSVDEIDLSQDPYITDTIKKILSLEQQALDILAGNNTGLETKDSKGEECDNYKEEFPCNTHKLINQAFNHLILDGTDYNTAIADIQKQISRYEQTREPMDKRDENYLVLKEKTQQYLSTLKQQSQLTQLKQVVDFSIIKGQSPTVADCQFILTTADGTTDNSVPKRCFDMAYESQWNTQFDAIIQAYYQDDVAPNIQIFNQQFSDEEKSLRRVD